MATRGVQAAGPAFTRAGRLEGLGGRATDPTVAALAVAAPRAADSGAAAAAGAAILGDRRVAVHRLRDGRVEATHPRSRGPGPRGDRRRSADPVDARERRLLQRAPGTCRP